MCFYELVDHKTTPLTCYSGDITRRRNSEHYAARGVHPRGEMTHAESLKFQGGNGLKFCIM